MVRQTNKLSRALKHWDYNRLLRDKEERAAWLESEATYIKGMIHRATRTPLKNDIKTLEIGAGPCDVIDHWHDGEKHAIDPLAKEYTERFNEFRDPSVNYVAGYAEELPYEDSYFDVVIVRNALDHFDDPHQALCETYRVLKPNGALYVWTYLYSWPSSLGYRLINILTKQFETEPWAFTMARIKRHLTRTGFIPCLPAVEERPSSLGKAKSVTGWLKLTLRKILGFREDRGFSCVALSQKGIHKGWKVLGLDA